MHSRSSIITVSAAVVVCLVLVAFQPMLGNFGERPATTQQTQDEIPAAFRGLNRFVGELMNNTDDTNHSDSDGLPDTKDVDAILGKADSEIKAVSVRHGVQEPWS